MANEDGALADAPPPAKLKFATKGKGVFSENCGVLQPLGKALTFILRLLK